MKTLYIDCSMGAAGDMLCSALIELTQNEQKTVDELNQFNIPHVKFSAEKVKKCGIVGTQMHVLVDGAEEGETHGASEHNSLGDVCGIINGLNIADGVKAASVSVYEALAEAESRVHNTDVRNIHFHEIGTLDAIADIVAFCYLIDKLQPERIVSSPVNVGKGSVKCAHGILPVPAPATALLLTGIPSYSDGTVGELCTPTGAALLSRFVNEFSDMPCVQTEKIGYGMGKKDFERTNCVRMLFGESDGLTDSVVELSFNVDDMTGEEIAFGTEELLRNGAKDVFVSAVGMKKNRPGQLVTVLCDVQAREETVRNIFKYFSTLGIREYICTRYVMERRIERVETGYGTVSRKISRGYGQTRIKYEYKDLARIARENGCSIQQIRKAIENGEEE